jgi:hypothetical protein
LNSKNNYIYDEYFDNLLFLFNNPCIFICDPNNPLESLKYYLNQNSSHINKNTNLIIGIKLNILFEIFSNSISFKWFVKSRKFEIIEYLINSEFKIENILAVYPNIYTPRFCFNLNDSSSHKLLINEILLPRKYSLTYINRLLLMVFSNIVTKYKNSGILVNNIFIIAKKVTKK